MTKIGRYNLSEISLSRIMLALKVRLSEIPHSIAWRSSLVAQENREKIRTFNNLHQNQRCFIVANGPSLAKTDLQLLEDEITFGLNRIYLYFDKTSFRPSYYLSVNELVLEQYWSEISTLQMPKFLNWNRRGYFDPHDRNIMFVKSKMVINDFFQYDLTRPLVIGGTVTFVALQLAFYMGFNQVILVGLDHNFDEKGAPSGIEIRTSQMDQNHFHPNYFPKGSKWQRPDLLRSEVDYSIARNAFETDGREILDATIDGKCTVFKKKEYMSIFD